MQKNKTNKMYTARVKNIPVFRGCDYDCVYCSFKRLVQLNKKCPQCAVFEPHAHLEALQRTPPKTKKDEFITVGLSSDVSFMEGEDFDKVLDYCRKWGDRTFLIQSKNPEYFLQFAHRIPDNALLGCTIETNMEQIWTPGTAPRFINNMNYRSISKAPIPEKRYAAMLKLDCRKAITIEPILDLNIKTMEDWICRIKPEILYIGYCNDGKNGAKLRLPEPELQKAYALIDRLRRNTYGTEVRIKTMRPAWWEK